MRKFNKYKVYIKNSFNFFYKRILKFKKTKWKKTQQRILILKLKRFVFNHQSLIKRIKFWDRIKFNFRNQILQKNKIQSRIDNKFYKKYKNFFLNIFILEYRLDFLLNRLKIFKSIYHSKNFILTGNVYVNSKICFNNKIILKKGDIISFKKNSFLFIENKYPKISKEIFFSFFQYDLYTQTVVIIKSYFEINFLDLSLILQENLKL